MKRGSSFAAIFIIIGFFVCLIVFLRIRQERGESGKLPWYFTENVAPADPFDAFKRPFLAGNRNPVFRQAGDSRANSLLSPKIKRSLSDNSLEKSPEYALRLWLPESLFLKKYDGGLDSDALIGAYLGAPTGASADFLPNSPFGKVATDVDVDLTYREFYLRDTGGIHSYAPVTLNLIRPIYSDHVSRLRPQISAGFGVLGQSGSAALPADREFELRMLWRVGTQMEWEPYDSWIFRAGYEYSRLTSPSEMSPDLPQENHGVTLGVEHKF